MGIYSNNIEVQGCSGILIVDDDINTSDGNIVSADVLLGKIAYSKGKRYVGTCLYDANTKDATATENNILKGKTAYINGRKIIGTFEILPEKVVEGQEIAGVIGKNRALDFIETRVDNLPILTINSNVIMG